MSQDAQATADRINLLFAHIGVRNGQEPYSDETAARELFTAGMSVTAQELAQLRAGGGSSDPDSALLDGIAALFDIPPAYFTDDEVAAKIADEIRVLVRAKRLGVQGIHACGAKLTIPQLDGLLDQLEQEPRLA